MYKAFWHTPLGILQGQNLNSEISTIPWTRFPVLEVLPASVKSGLFAAAITAEDGTRSLNANYGRDHANFESGMFANCN